MISDDSIDYQCRIALENPKAIIEESEIQRLESKLDDQLLKIYHHGWVIEAVEALQVNCDEQLVVETLITLRTNPDLVVQVLKLLNNQNAAYDFLELCFSSAYGAGILKDDEDFCMLLYKSLLDTNWLSPFVRMFSIRRFCCQGFFICALREPMLNVLAEDDWYLDIDRDSILSHFTQSEITKRFGDDDTFEIRLQTYTDIMSRKLASLCVGFLERMLFNLTALPKCIRQMLREYFILSKNENEVIRMFVVDVMGNYLHDPIGSDLVDNTFITAIAQYNINQISSLLLEYLTSSSLPSSMKSKFTNTINYLFAEEKNQFRSKLLDIIGSSIDTLPLDDNNDVYLPRESFLLTYNEVHNLFDYLFTLNGVTSGNLQDLISALPSKTQMKQLFDIRTNDAIGSGRIIHGERILVFRLPLSSTENAKSAPYNTLSRSSKLVTSSDVSKRLRFSMNENKDNYRQISYSSSILEFPQSESVGSAGPISVDDTGSSDDVIGTGSVEGIDKTSVEVDLDMLSGRESPNNGYESSGRCSVNSAFIGNEATSIMNGPNVTEKFNMFDLPKSQCQDEYKLAQSDNWSTVVGASDCDPTERVNRLCDIVEENPIVQDLIRMHPQRLTSRESDLWSIEPSVSENVTSLDGKSDESFEAFRLIDGKDVGDIYINTNFDSKLNR
ncbi:hypothetical protein GJ496_006408 [Pomphorhynchus laevis]|nr:hypothetical protein GJ496_006408 [Pomphorhynchus laevis]